MDRRVRARAQLATLIAGMRLAAVRPPTGKGPTDSDPGRPDRWGDDGFEVAEYIASFKSSAKRVRWVMFIIATVSIVALFPTWNATQWSWSKQRQRLWAQDQIEAAKRRVVAQSADELARLDAQTMLVKFGRGSARELRDLVSERLRGEYVGRIADEYMFLHVPGMQVATDVNELGLIAGVTFGLLMLLLLTSHIRVHENLHLCCFKMVRLFDEDGRKEDGDSRANFLYHALAMGEVVGAPPTLARWHHARWPVFNRNFWAKLVLLVPLAMQGVILLTNWLTIDAAVRTFGRVPVRFWVSVSLLLPILALTYFCYLYWRACHKQWRAAFYHINPSRRTREPEATWVHWVRLRSPWSKDERSMRAELQRATIEPLPTEGAKNESALEGPVDVSYVVPREWDASRRSMLLMKAGRRVARRWCRDRNATYLALAEYKLSQRTTDDGVKLEIQWWFRCRHRDRVSAGG